MQYSCTAVFRIVVVLVSVLLSELNAQSPCSGAKAGLDWVPNQQDCNAFYICAFGRPIPLHCGKGLVWQAEKKVCCLKNSALDTCSTKLKAPQPKALSGLPKEPETCQPGMTKKLPHPNHCARYMDCSTKGKMLGMMEEQERECPYPKFFNTETGDCDEYENVDCEIKTAPKDACDYVMNQCHRSHCIPCSVRFPSCKGLKDGQQMWMGRKNSPFFAECKNERVMKHGRCRGGQLFHPDLRQCVDAKTMSRR